jgi:hypothetical protein
MEPMVKAAFPVVRMRTSSETMNQQAFDRGKRALGDGEAVNRFLSSYGNLRTKRSYSVHLTVYLRWLRDERGVTLSPDELVKDNLVCIFKSDPSEVATKRKRRA